MKSDRSSRGEKEAVKSLARYAKTLLIFIEFFTRGWGTDRGTGAPPDDPSLAQLGCRGHYLAVFFLVDQTLLGTETHPAG
jgi:hypothetical protein